MKKYLLLLPLAFILLSCAGSYKTIAPQALFYPGDVEDGKISYSYRYDVLSPSGNKKYANKERKSAVKLVAIKLTNNTGRNIQFKKDVEMYLNGELTLPVSPVIVAQQFKQPAGLYMLWSLLWVFITSCDNGDCSSTPIPLGFFIGLGNTATASGANKHFRSELNETNLLEQEIMDGKTVFGLVGVTTEYLSPITLKIR